MAGVVYMKSNSSVSLTGAEYTGLSIPSGAKTLYVQTGSATSDRVKYGLTTDTSASVYSPFINVSGTTMYIASGGTFTETVTTGTVYHTATRASTSETGTVTSWLTSTFARTSIAKRIYNITYKGHTNITQYKNTNTVYTAGSYTYYPFGISNVNSTSSYKSGSFTDKTWIPLHSDSNITTICTIPNPHSTNMLTKFDLGSFGSCSRTGSGVFYTGTWELIYVERGTSRSGSAYLTMRLNSKNPARLGYVTFLTTNNLPDTVTTGCNTVESYLTCSSTYTSRTEYLTSGNTYTTNNIAS